MFCRNPQHRGAAGTGVFQGFPGFSALAMKRGGISPGKGLRKKTRLGNCGGSPVKIIRSRDIIPGLDHKKVP
jgi:hypothetical protein